MTIFMRLQYNPSALLRGRAERTTIVQSANFLGSCEQQLPFCRVFSTGFSTNSVNNFFASKWIDLTGARIVRDTIESFACQRVSQTDTASGRKYNFSRERRRTTMNRKVTVVGGAGNVGATVARSIAEKELADVVIVDIADQKAAGVALDILETCPIIGSDSLVIGGRIIHRARTRISWSSRRACRESLA